MSENLKLDDISDRMVEMIEDLMGTAYDPREIPRWIEEIAEHLIIDKGWRKKSERINETKSS